MNQWAKTKHFPKSPDKLTGDNRGRVDSPEKMLAVAKKFVAMREKAGLQPQKSGQPTKPAKPRKPKK